MQDVATVTDGGRATLLEYARTQMRGEPILKGYRPRTAVLAALAEALPMARMLVFSGGWCVDCRREVPKMARIAEHLPAGWRVEIAGEDEALKRRHHVLAIPTFLVLDSQDGRELGRIVESPESPDGLEGDLLAIARRAGVGAEHAA